MSHSDDAIELIELFGQMYLHLHSRSQPSDYQLTRESLAVLRHLAVSGPLSVTEAAAHFGRSQAATSEQIDRLVERGLLARMPDERDRRRHLVWLTETGQALLVSESEPLDRERVARVLAALAPGDRDQLLTGLRRAVGVALQQATEERKLR